MFSIIATSAPIAADVLDILTPPEPAPITIRSKSYEVILNILGLFVEGGSRQPNFNKANFQVLGVRSFLG